MAAGAPKGWVLTFGLAALVVAAGLVAHAISPAPLGAMDPQPHAERCIRYGQVECCLHPDEAH